MLENRANANAELVLEEYEFTASNGKEYTVKPIPFKYILKGTFSKDKLFIPSNENNATEYQLLNITDEKRKKKLDKWLNLLVCESETEENITLEKISKDNWVLSDIGKVLMLIVEISGLVKKEETEIVETEEKKNEYIFLFSLLTENGSMSKAEILSHSLPYIYSIAEEIQNNRIQTMGMSMGMGMFGGVPSASPNTNNYKTTTSMEDFVNMVNG